MNSFHLFLLVVGFVSAFPGTQKCTSETVNVVDQWSMPKTVLAADQTCDLSFVIPVGFFALVNVEAKNLDYFDVISIYDPYGDSVSKIGNSKNFSSSLAWPGFFSINIQTQEAVGMEIQINVSLKKASPLTKMAGTFKTGVNKPSTVLYFDDFIEGTSYSFISETKLNLKTTNLGNAQLNNIFVYDGGDLVGSLLSIGNTYVFKAAQVTLYVAKEVSIKGALLATEAANVARLDSHLIAYASVDQVGKTQSRLIKGGPSSEGALTIIREKNDSFNIEVLRVSTQDDLKGIFSYLEGGPLRDHPQSSQLNTAVLPKKINSNLITLYLSQGRGTVKYVPSS